MSRSKNIITLTTIALLIFASLSFRTTAINWIQNKFLTSNNLDQENKMAIKVALLLDTSGSMSGLIEQAKSQLWNILSELNYYEKKGERPTIQIALYEYGKDKYGPQSGFIKQLLPFTSDMDLVSAELFSLRTSGSNEYCGEVIHRSIQDLDWGSSPNDLKLLYIAGNESFAQGKYPYAQACVLAREKGIVVNTIYCGNKQDGVELQWRDGAEKGNGEYMFIDHNAITTYISSPYDDQIGLLNDQLNETYIPLGDKGVKAHKNQSSQDQNAGAYGSANIVDRASFKISDNYNNSSWDLVDAYKKDKSILATIDQLPQAYQSLSEKELKSRVEKMISSRESIKYEMAQLKRKRDDYIQGHKSKLSSKNGLQSSIIYSVKKAANTIGFYSTKDKIKNKDLSHATSDSIPLAASAYPKALVNYKIYADLISEIQPHRAQRLVSLNKFIEYSKEENTVILDTRSKMRYDRKHIKGAIHLNFSDFTQLELNRLLPNNDKTKILIYCNNNFLGDPVDFASKVFTPIKSTSRQLLAMSTPASLALNIPTYINLYGYGYRNIYELDEMVNLGDQRIELEGSQVIKSLDLE